jgi:hypothetical protein
MREKCQKSLQLVLIIGTIFFISSTNLHAQNINIFSRKVVINLLKKDLFENGISVKEVNTLHKSAITKDQKLDKIFQELPEELQQALSRI